jgi:hypothetical protein
VHRSMAPCTFTVITIRLILDATIFPSTRYCVVVSYILLITGLHLVHSEIKLPGGIHETPCLTL